MRTTSTTADSIVASPWPEWTLSALLALQIAYVFVLTPLAGLEAVPHTVVRLCVVLIAIASAVAARGGRVTRAVVLFAFAASTIAPVAVTLEPTNMRLQCVAMAVGALFTATITVVVGRAALRPGSVSHFHIQGALVVYLNLALLFVTAYGLLLLFVPDAFRGMPDATHSRFAATLYLSLGTLTTVGSGDVAAVHPLARSLVTLEAVTGQLFIATVIARLASLHSAHRGASMPSAA